eukprot:15616-Eustigmatos_ZCMA.PRE.1
MSEVRRLREVFPRGLRAGACAASAHAGALAVERLRQNEREGRERSALILRERDALDEHLLAELQDA